MLLQEMVKVGNVVTMCCIVIIISEGIMIRALI